MSAFTVAHSGRSLDRRINCVDRPFKPAPSSVLLLLFRRVACRCIGRIAWNSLVVRDKRHVTDVAEMFAECMEHQRLAMADGRFVGITDLVLFHRRWCCQWFT